jgi:hypothetical protein
MSKLPMVVKLSGERGVASSVFSPIGNVYDVFTAIEVFDAFNLVKNGFKGPLAAYSPEN